MQVLIGTALEILKASIKATDDSARFQDTLNLLVAGARVAPDSILQNILDSIDHFFLSTPQKVLQNLEPGDPYATLLSTAPHLASWLPGCIDRILLEISSSHTPEKFLKAVLSHLSPFLVQCMVSEHALAESAAAALASVAARRAECLDACCSCMLASTVLSCSVSAQVQGFYSIPQVLFSMLTQQEYGAESQKQIAVRMPTATHLLHSLLTRELNAKAQSMGRPRDWVDGAQLMHGMHARASSMQVAATATQLLSLIVSRSAQSATSAHASYATCGHFADALNQLALAAIHAAHTPTEVCMLRMLCTALQGPFTAITAASDDPSQALMHHVGSLMHAVQLQLLHHVALPCSDTLKQVSATLLAKTDELHSTLRNTPLPPLRIQPPFATWEAQTAATMHVHACSSGHKDKMATMDFLNNLTHCAVQSISDEVRLQRCQASVTAIATGTLWPSPIYVICPTDAVTPPGYAVQDRIVPSGRKCSFGFVPSPVLVAHVVALLDHASLQCVLGAAQALVATACAAPAAVVQCFPALLSNAQRALSSLGKMESHMTPEGTIRLLLPFALLPQVCQAPEMDGMFYALCAQLLEDSAGAKVCMLGMRMLLTFWLVTGRGYQRVRDVMHAFQTPSPDAPLSVVAAATPPEDTALRRAVAACAAAVAWTAPEKATEAVAIMHGAMNDSDDGTVALALESIAAMCREVSTSCTLVHSELDFVGKGLLRCHFDSSIHTYSNPMPQAYRIV